MLCMLCPKVIKYNTIAIVRDYVITSHSHTLHMPHTHTAPEILNFEPLSTYSDLWYVNKNQPAKIIINIYIMYNYINYNFK